MSKLFYIVGPSASGKDTIYRHLINQSKNITPFVSCTTREKRSGEVEGREYHFVTLEEKEKLEQANKIIEMRSYDAVVGTLYYFTPAIDLTESVYVGVGTIDSLESLINYYGKEKVVPIYIQVSDILRLSRCVEREGRQANPNAKEICRRFLSDKEEYTGERLKAIPGLLRVSNDTSVTSSVSTCLKIMIEEMEKNN